MDLDYKIKNGNKCIRRQNRKNFVSDISGSKKNNIAILSIHFNNSQNTKNLLNYLSIEDNQNFDIILIENSNSQKESEKLADYIQNISNVTIIKPVSNLGSAGGYALGMEYIIHQNYNYFFLVEDDVIFLERNVFSKMIASKDNETLTFINNCKNTRDSSNTKFKGKSWRVQIAGYPVNFIEKIGIIDPRYFFRGEDLDGLNRIEKGIKNLGYKTKVIDTDYLHPYLKSVNGNYTWFYFSIRNQLLSLKKDLMKNYMFLITLFFYLWTALSKILIEKDNLILKSFVDAVSDFILNRFSWKRNKDKIESFLKQINKNIDYQWMEKKELNEISKELYGEKRILCITGFDLENISFSKKISNIWKHGILISSSSTVFYPLTTLAEKVVCINEIDLMNHKISVSQYVNRFFLKNLILIILTFVASVGLIIILEVMIVLYILVNKGLKKK